MESVIAGDPGPNEDLRDHSAAGRVVASIGQRGVFLAALRDHPGADRLFGRGGQ